MPELPDVDQSAKDSAALVRADLGVVGRVRLKLAGFCMLVGAALMPPAFREAAADLSVTDEGE